MLAGSFEDPTELQHITERVVQRSWRDPDYVWLSFINDDAVVIQVVQNGVEQARSQPDTQLSSSCFGRLGADDGKVLGLGFF